jgi:hypothetical protein
MPSDVRNIEAPRHESEGGSLGFDSGSMSTEHTQGWHCLYGD